MYSIWYHKQRAAVLWHWRQVRIISYSATECPCSMTLEAAPTSQPCIFAGLKLCWAGYHHAVLRWRKQDSNRAPIALVAARGQWLTVAKGQAMAAGFMSSTLGCGNMARASHAGLLSPRLSSSVRLALPTLATWVARGQQSPWSATKERGEDYYSSRSQQASEGLSQSWIKEGLYSMLYKSGL